VILSRVVPCDLLWRIILSSACLLILASCYPVSVGRDLLMWRFLWQVQVRLPLLSHLLCVPMCPGTHATSMLALLFLSRKCGAVSTNLDFCDIRWLDLGFLFVIEATEDMLSACCLRTGLFLPALYSRPASGVAVPSPLNSVGISAPYPSACLPMP